jgi:hypothetical protein
MREENADNRDTTDAIGMMNDENAIPFAAHLRLLVARLLQL